MKALENMSLKETIDEALSAAADKMSSMQIDIENLETVVGRIGAPPGGGSSSDGISNEHSKIFENWFRTGDNGGELRRIENSLSTVSDPGGGYLVPVTLDTAIDGLVGDSVAMRRLATVKTGIRGDYKKPLDVGQFDAGWVTELQARPETDNSELAMFSPAWGEIYANPSCTQSLLDNAEFNISEWLSSAVALKFAEMEGEAFITGDGKLKPRGILTYNFVDNSNWETGKVGYVPSGGTSTIGADDLIDLQHSLKPVFRQKGVFLMNDSTWGAIRKLKDGDGNYIWTPGLKENSPNLLLGKPVEIDDNMPSISAGEYPIAFGDFKRAYLILDHAVGVRILRDPFSQLGRVSMYTTKRISSGIYNHQAIKVLKISA